MLFVLKNLLVVFLRVLRAAEDEHLELGELMYAVQPAGFLPVSARFGCESSERFRDTVAVVRAAFRISPAW